MRARLRGATPSRLDLLIAFLLTVYAQGELVYIHGFTPLAAALSAVITLAVAWRRVGPVPSAVLVITVYGLQALVLDPPPELLGNAIAVLVAAFTAAAYAGPRLALPALGLAVVSFIAFERSQGTPDMAVGDLVMVAATWCAGWFVWRRRCASEEQLSAAMNQALSAASRADATLAEERRRIARELHDVVSHAVTVVVLQARGGRTMLDRDPRQTRAALDAIETSGQQALAEMRRLVTLLREPGVDTTPQPGIGDVERLVAGAAQSVDASMRVHGDPVQVSPGVGLTLFRLVQECLTNALRHSPGAAVRVDLDYGPRAVTVTVRSFDGVTSPTTDGSGHGLIGMRERVELYGGTLDFGEVEGSWMVSGTIPYTDLEGAPSATLVATSPGLEGS